LGDTGREIAKKKGRTERWKVEMWVEGEVTGMESSANLISSLSSNPNQRNPFSLHPPPPPPPRPPPIAAPITPHTHPYKQTDMLQYQPLHF